jgi:TolB-like protein/Tfp pilus assembly protein PilF
MAQETDDTTPKLPPVDRLSQLWRRINEHKLVQWTVAYVAVAYAVQHAVVLTGEAFEWPAAVLRVSMLLMVLGLPVVLTLAWYHGERASRHFSTGELTIISLLLVIGSVVFYAFVQPQEEVASTQPAAQQTGVEAAKAAAASPAGVSVAVLPFANVSIDPEQEFFSDGITDEISGALAKIPDLRVVGRTSAFQYKTRNTDLRSIGQALNATHLIEGSVRKAGERVRITVQLIQAENGLQIWTENYDRALTDVFAIQEDIARAIATSFNMRLGLAPGENLITSRDIDPEAYQEFLRARARVRGRLPGRDNLEQLIAHTPGFAPAWGLLAQRYLTLQGLDNQLMSIPIDEARNLLQSSLEQAEKAAREAIRLDPQLAVGFQILAYLEFQRRNLGVAEDMLRKALAIDSSDPDLLSAYATMLNHVGRIKDALQLREQVNDLEPFIPLYNNFLATALLSAGQNDAAIGVLEASHPTGAQLNFRNERLSRAYAAAGRLREAAETIRAIADNRYGDSGVSRDAAARLMRSAPANAGTPRTLPVLPGRLNFVYAYVGAQERMFEYPERGLEVGFIQQPLQNIWEPLHGPLRKTERFKTLVRNAGMVDYWRARGWPEFCRPTTGDDFVCD